MFDAFALVLLWCTWALHYFWLDQLGSRSPDGSANWDVFWSGLSTAKLGYALMAFPFLLFKVPYVGVVLTGRARRTGYDRSGVLAGKLSKSELRAKYAADMKTRNAIEAAAKVVQDRVRRRKKKAQPVAQGAPLNKVMGIISPVRWRASKVDPEGSGSCMGSESESSAGGAPPSPSQRAAERRRRRWWAPWRPGVDRRSSAESLSGETDFFSPGEPRFQVREGGDELTIHKKLDGKTVGSAEMV